MTTAARPTFDTARGGTQRGEGNLSVLSKQYSSRDLPSHTKIKTRYFATFYIGQIHLKTLLPQRVCIDVTMGN